MISRSWKILLSHLMINLILFHFRFAMMEEKIILSTILRKFDVFSVTKPKEISLLAELVLRPKNGLHVQFSKRHNREWCWWYLKRPDTRVIYVYICKAPLGKRGEINGESSIMASIGIQMLRVRALFIVLVDKRQIAKLSEKLPNFLSIFFKNILWVLLSKMSVILRPS